MSENLIQLESIMSEELSILSNILRLEREKSEAIISKDGISLQKISYEQELCLANIAPIENNRKIITDYYSKINNKKQITLRQITEIEGKKDSPLSQIGDLLKRTLEKIKLLQETNVKMINDNLDFFKKVIKDLSCFSNDIGYSAKGIEKTNSKSSFLLDKKI
jgi:hypothetical protein